MNRHGTVALVIRAMLMDCDQEKNSLHVKITENVARRGTVLAITFAIRNEKKRRIIETLREA
jgi:hypothetical protein